MDTPARPLWHASDPIRWANVVQDEHLFYVVRFGDALDEGMRFFRSHDDAHAYARDWVQGS